jgi:uncharacterized membrane protein
LKEVNTSLTQNIFRTIIYLVYSGFSHLTFNNRFQAQVPDWVPLSKNLVVLLSGIVEIALGRYYSGKATSEFWMGLSHILYPSFPGKFSPIP